MRNLFQHKNSWFSILLLNCVFFFVSCSPARRLAEGENLYYREKIKVDRTKIDPANLRKYSRMGPNKQIVGFGFHLAVYNLAKPGKDKGLSKWFRKIGEPPVKYDSMLVKQNSRNFGKYLSDIGYNQSTVSDSVFIDKKRRVFVEYRIRLGEPTLINSLTYSFEDTSIRIDIYADTSFSLLKVNSAVNKQLMQEERLRMELALKDHGYYKFSKEYIFYEIAQTNDPLKQDVKIVVKQSITGTPDPISHIREHRRYLIRDVYIMPLKQKKDSIFIKPDTLSNDNYKFVYFGEMPVKPLTLISVNRIYPGTLYSKKSMDRSYTNFSTLGLFRYININYTETEPSKEHNNLDCKIEMAMRKRQSLSVEGVVTNSDFDFGVNGSLNYNNYNLFKGGEQLQIALQGSQESLRHRFDNDTIDPMKKFGVSTKFETPKFLLPFIGQEFQKKFSPRTTFQLSYSNQRLPVYIRIIANGSFGYNWKGNDYNRHIIYPIDFYLVNLPFLDQKYYDTTIANTNLQYSYENHAILGCRYVFEFSTQQSGFSKNFIYLRSSIESAGPLVYLTEKLTPRDKDSVLFGVNYFQYLRSDLDFRHFNVLNSINRIIYRLYIGVGVPYAVSNSMPSEKMFSAGGPYGIRAWSEGTLGPGSYSDTNKVIYQYYGDIKLEGNIEYRFKLFWKMEGALFVDAGNIWAINQDSLRPGAEFKFDKFYKDIAIGTGFGLRMDLSFVLLRADFGFKLRDPARIESEKWTILNKDGSFGKLTFQFGVGYPF